MMKQQWTSIKNNLDFNFDKIALATQINSKQLILFGTNEKTEKNQIKLLNLSNKEIGEDKSFD